MRQWLDKFYETPTGKITVYSVLALILCIGGYSAYASFGPNADAADLASRTFICSDTLKTFTVRMSAGMKFPVASPYSSSGKGYPAEFCYWNADGSIKNDPTPVLLNSYIGKPEPTFCPDCGRLIVPGKIKPDPADKAPPTKAQYDANPKRYQHNSEQ